MLLTITTAHRPATDLGYLLHKHPDRAQSFPVAAARTAHVFYPKAGDDACTAALLLDVDPVTLVRGGHDAVTLDQYVNDRPYVAGSMLAVSIGSVFRTAMTGASHLQELADTAIPLVLELPVVPMRGGFELAHRLFTPLGWEVVTTPIPLDPEFPQWGAAPYAGLRLTGTARIRDALKHLYVLLPVLDDEKHYRVGEDEIDKLIRAGDGWLREHPEREFISRRYLRYRTQLVRSALARLADADDVDAADLDALADARVVAEPQRTVPLAEQRRLAVVAELRTLGAHRIVDMGCGGGALLRELVKDVQFTEIVGVDVSSAALGAAERALARLSERVRSRVTLRQSALTYIDPGLAGYDAAVLMEVIEHVDEPRLSALERSVFGYARPASVIVTTPNIEYNVRFETLPSGQLRHRDHRFEWSRQQFRAWADGVAERNGYTVRYLSIGEIDRDLGAPTQGAVFEVSR